MTRRHLAAQVLSLTGLLELSARAGTASDSVIVLAYHRVAPPEAVAETDDGALSATPEQFAQHVRYLQRHFTVISCGELCALLNGDGPGIRRRRTMITFDDGYRDNCEVAYPILKAHGVPATVFISTYYVDQQQPFWWDVVSYAIKRTGQEEVICRSVPFRQPLRSPEERRGACQRLLNALKRIPDEQRQEAIVELRHTLLPDNSGGPPPVALTWPQIREMSRNGIEFGSHTVTHPVLSQVSDDRCLRELQLSKERLESELGVPVSSLSYPVGGPRSFDARTVRLAKECGYQLAFTYCPGQNRVSRLDRFAIRRLHVEADMPIALFNAQVVCPGLFAWAR